MARFRRLNPATHPVNRIKHIVDSSATLTAGTTLEVELIKSVDAPVLANTTECITGSKVNGLYLNVQVGSNETDAGAIPNFYMALYKNPADAIGLLNPTSLGDDDRKRYVIHQEMVMMNNLVGGNPRTVFSGVIAIPRGYRRNGPDDRLQLVFHSPQVNVAVCVQCIYKEFR